MKNPELKRRFIEKATSELSSFGFKKRAGQIYTCDIAEDYLGWIGLNQGTYPNEGFEINPVIGVRHQELEKLVAVLQKKKPHQYIPSTTSRPLGYLMPEKSYKTWTFALAAPEKMDSPVMNMITAIEDFGLPFMKNHLSIDAIINGLNAGFGIPEQRTYRLAAGYLLAGKRELVKEIADDWSERLGDRNDLAAQQARRFIISIKDALNPGTSV
jgi:hypothetical protein